MRLPNGIRSRATAEISNRGKYSETIHRSQFHYEKGGTQQHSTNQVSDRFLGRGECEWETSIRQELGTIALFRYFMVLVQEMSVQADKGFINAIIAMFTNEAAVTYGVSLGSFHSLQFS